ncbi:dienelactone hydrolase [Deinococcus aerolatus]|uniref:Dienelactone hydrolase n=1 Tax=Deinococcus aerolatus TaxID=522487 RepID=A0ABQ2G9N5_9DEIO|nr:dienelactone hydrolase family protein [Deinococcus aerolatus]GGL82531.1 dienelactone hydrolase [Deinococcus aerolatus]
MSELLLFHHAQGLTSGVVAFADALREAGHTVHTPDLYHGKTFDTLDDGIAYARQLGFGNIAQSGVDAARNLSTALVYAGFSLGVSPAQQLAQTRPGARGALLFHGCLPVSEFGASWPSAVPVQVHAMDHDPFFEEDAGAAQALVKDAPLGELFLYRGDQHLFTDRSLSSYDEAATSLLMRRVLEFLKRN